MVLELFPAFNYARDKHRIINCPQNDVSNATRQTIIFESETERLHVDIHVDSSAAEVHGFPAVKFELQDKPGYKGPGLYAKVQSAMEQSITFLIHSEEVKVHQSDLSAHIDRLERETFDFWTIWTRQRTFTGHH